MREKLVSEASTCFMKIDDFGKSTHIEENIFKCHDWLHELIRMNKAYQVIIFQ